MSILILGFPDSSVGIQPPCNAGDLVQVRKIYWRRDRLPTPVLLGFPCGSAGTESAYNVGDLGREDPLEKGSDFNYKSII